jgi:hypothetical protein
MEEETLAYHTSGKNDAKTAAFPGILKIALLIKRNSRLP